MSRKGDPVAVFMPMVAEAVIAAYAIAKLGALYMPIFSGFAPSAVASRLQDAKAKVIVTADGGLRRGSQGLMKPVADEAVAESPSVEHIVVLERLGADVAMTPGRDLTWDELRARGLDAAPDGIECEDTESEDVLMIAYTSGTTGRPKGAVHVHGGFLVKMASEAFYQADLHPDDTLYWVTDMGWIMGPWEMVGAGCIGATVVMYEGAPDWPEPDRVWASVERHRVNVLGVSPTLIRALRTAGDEHPDKHDLSSLRVFGSTGEPWNPEPYKWLSEVVGGGPRADHQHLGRHGGRRLLPDALSRRGAEGVLARRRLARHGRGRVRPGREPGARRGRGARLQAAVARNDARHLGRQPSATWRPTGRCTRTSGATATGR